MDETVKKLPGNGGKQELHSFAFQGRAWEYFGIWIVNLLLTIVTVGIYSAWAKVRALRYFYGNTILDSHNFEYHARPVQILIGRIIVVAAILTVNVLIMLHPGFGVLIFAYLAALPWLINRGLAFSARMTSYRNVRFSFAGGYWRAFLIFVLMPFAAIFTLGLLIPVVSKMTANYIGNNLKYGTTSFRTKAALRPLYANFGLTLIILAIMVAVFALAVLVTGAGSEFSANLAEIAAEEREPPRLITVGIFLAYAGFIVAYLFYSAGVRNVAYNASRLGDHVQLRSDIGRLRYVWIMVSNLVAVICTIGLALPWATVRRWRYLAGGTSLLAATTLDSFTDAAAPEGNVAAGEFLDIEGIQFGI